MTLILGLDPTVTMLITTNSNGKVRGSSISGVEFTGQRESSISPQSTHRDMPQYKASVAYHRTLERKLSICGMLMAVVMISR